MLSSKEPERSSGTGFSEAMAIRLSIGLFCLISFQLRSLFSEQKSLKHIKEELEYHYGPIGLGNTLSGLDTEVDFHIFNLHDFDKNQLLDGLEMLAMLERHDESQHIHRSAHSLEQNIAVIDLVLSSEDTNNDGFLDYNEFRKAKTRHDLKGI